MPRLFFTSFSPHQVFAGAQEIKVSASVRNLIRSFEPVKLSKLICLPLF